MKRQTKFEILLGLILIARSTSFMISKIMMDGMEPFTILANRYIIAFALLIVIFAKRLKNTDKNLIIKGCIIGAVYTAVMGFEMYGLRLTDSGTCSFIEHIAIVIVPVMQAFLIKKFPGKETIISAVLALTGVGFLTIGRAGIAVNKGFVYCLIAAVCYAVAIIITTNYSKEVSDSIMLGIFQLGFMGLFCLILALISESPRIPQNGNEWFSILYLAIVCSGFGIGIQPFAQSGTTAERSALIAALNPLSVAILGVVILKEKLTVAYVIGGSLIMIAILLSVVYENAQNRISEDISNS